MPLMNGSKRLMAAPLNNDHKVGGLYRMTGEPVEGGDAEGLSSPGEYCSLSECMVMPDSVRLLDGSSEAIARCGLLPLTALGFGSLLGVVVGAVGSCAGATGLRNFRMQDGQAFWTGVGNEIGRAHV